MHTNNESTKELEEEGGKHFEFAAALSLFLSLPLAYYYEYMYSTCTNTSTLINKMYFEECVISFNIS